MRRKLSATEAFISARLGSPSLFRFGAGTVAVWPKGSDGSEPYLSLHRIGQGEGLSAEFVGLRRDWTIAGGSFPNAPLTDLATALSEATLWMDSHRIGGSE